MFFTLNSVCLGQKIVKQLTIDEGISEMQCFDVFQDSKGYIWIGTSAGINRYDGKDIMKFDLSNGLLSYHIYAFYEDSQNRIWINNLNGEPMFIKNNLVHNRYTDPYLEDLKGSSYLSGWCEDKYNRIWFSHSEGYLKVLDQESTFKVEVIAGYDSLELRLHGVFEYQDEIVIVTTDYIEGFDIKTYESKWKYCLNIVGFFSRKLLHEGKIFLFSPTDGHVFDLDKKIFTDLSRNDGNPSIYDCRVINDTVFLSTALGVSIVNDNVIQKYKLGAVIDNKAVSALYLDNNKDLWISTLKNGVFRYVNSEIDASRFAKYDNIVYINQFTKDSVFIIQSDWKLSLLVNNTLVKTIQLLRKDDNRINKMFYKNGEIWLIDKYQFHEDVLGNYKTHSFYNRDFHYNELTKKAVWLNIERVTILNDLDKIVNVNSPRLLLHENSDRCKNYKIDQPYCIGAENDDDIWIGAEYGLFRISKDVLDTLEIRGSITDLEISNNRIVGINYGKGIFEYDISTGKINTITTKGGLSTNHFTGLAISENDIWLSHASGICQIRKDANEIKFIKNFGRNHGVPRGGVSFINVIEGSCHFIINGKSYIINSESVMNDTLSILIDTSSLKMYEDESRLLNFECINFSFADKMSYLYRIASLDSIWTETVSEKIRLDHIPAGDYMFEIKASHPLNLPNPIMRKRLCIQKRWYSEWYFKIGLLFLFSGLLYFMVYIKAISFNVSNIKWWIRMFVNKYFVTEKSNTINIKDIAGVVQLINIDNIDFIKSSGNYLEIYTLEKKYTTRLTMSKAVAKFRNWDQFARVHRSYMVNFSKIEAVHHKLLKIRDIDIPFTDSYKDIVETKLQL